jgi:hypothetical protein
MVDLENQARSSSKRWSLALPVVALLVGLFVGLVIPHPFRWHGRGPSAEVAGGPAAPFVLSEWEYPGAKLLTKLQLGSSNVQQAGVVKPEAFLPSLYAQSTPDAIEAVWVHYNRLAGTNVRQFKADDVFSQMDSDLKLSPEAGTAGLGGTLVYTSETERELIRRGTLVTHRGEYTVAVFVSRGANEKQTHIELVVQRMPR